jgi:hypothetical protein
LEKRNEKQ